MMKRRTERLSGVLLCLGLAASTACSTVTPSSPAGQGSGGSGGLGGSGGSSSSSGILAGTGGACSAPCSGDLHSVLDCEGRVVETCPADHACLDGKCIDEPCQAAAASYSSYGCEFWSLKTEILKTGGCHAAFVANTWDVPVHLTVEYDGAPLEPTFVRVPHGKGGLIEYKPYVPEEGLAPGAAALLFLSNGTLDSNDFGAQETPDCPVEPAMADTAVYGSGIGKGFHISADRPVAAYQIMPYGGGATAITSATLLLPKAAWDDSYVAVSAYAQSNILLVGGIVGPSLAILAGDDDTDVTVTGVAPLLGGPGVASAGKGVPATYPLKRGEYLQFTQSVELTGSLVSASKPVALLGAATCMTVPVTHLACDSAQQQIPPLRAWGSEYAAVAHPARLEVFTPEPPPESSPWRIVGAVDGTELAFDPPQAGAPKTIHRGQVAEWSSPGPFVVRSQSSEHPFYLASYMVGAGAKEGEEGGPDLPEYNGQGDPEWVNVIPSAQFLESYTLFTDPTYPTTWLVLVRAGGEDAGEVELDCLGTISSWVAFGDFEYAYVPLSHDHFQDFGACSTGVRTLKSARPFGVTVWGWGSKATEPMRSTYNSYAYPGGASIRKINDVSIPK